MVLIAGKGHEAGQTSHGQTRPFDDRAELAGPLEARGTRVIDLTLAQIADIVGGELADIIAADAAATQGHRHRRIRFARSRLPAGCSSHCPARAPTATIFAAAAVAAGAVAVLAARPVGVPAIVVATATRPATARPACSSTTRDGSGAAVLAALAKLASAVAARTGGRAG